MSIRREALPSNAVANREPLPGSRKVYVAGPHGMRVPFREITLQPTRGTRGDVELNAPMRVYDTSGPYTDPAVEIDLDRGLPALRQPWILARGQYDRSAPVRPSAPGLAMAGPREVLRGRGNVTQMHYAKKGVVTPEMNTSRSARACPSSSFAARWRADAPSSRPTSTTPSPSR